MSRAERVRFHKQEADLWIYAQYGWICQTCFSDCRRYGRPQLAPRIGQGKTFRRMYGSLIIDHPLNRVPTCSGGCNDAQNIGNNPGKCRELLEKIRLVSPSLSDHIDEVIQTLGLPEPVQNPVGGLR